MNKVLWDAQVQEVLHKGLSDAKGHSLLADMDASGLSFLVHDIINICRSETQPDAKYIKMTRAINTALSACGDYRVTGYSLLNNLILAVEELGNADARRKALVRVVPLDIINAQMAEIKKMVHDHWPKEDVYRDIITGELAAMMLDVFESGRQLGKQEFQGQMHKVLEAWSEGE